MPNFLKKFGSSPDIKMARYQNLGNVHLNNFRWKKISVKWAYDKINWNLSLMIEIIDKMFLIVFCFEVNAREQLKSINFRNLTQKIQ